MDQKLIRNLGIVVGVFAVFILILFLFSSCTKKDYTYDRLEQEMIEVIKNYYAKNEDELPQQDKDTTTFTLKKMISEGMIAELSELFEDESVKCDGNVTVTNNNGFYLYSPYLSCGKEYQTVYLADKIIEDSLTEEGVGLYADGDRYVMKGEVTNNYVKYGEKIFRILSINEDNTLRVIDTVGKPYITWDDRYNAETGFASGINEYIINSLNSRVKDAVEALYDDETAYPEELKGFITTQDLCVGKRSKEDTTKDGSTECAQKLEAQPLGLIAVYEYLQASLDPNCDSTRAPGCKNYNWINKSKLSTWSVTADSASSRYVYLIGSSVALSNAYLTANIKPVVNLSERAIYVAGDGTKESPYEFR